MPEPMRMPKPELAAAVVAEEAPEAPDSGVETIAVEAVSAAAIHHVPGLH